jgi:hypothetical protein
MVAPLVLGGIGAGVGLLNNLFGSHKPQVTRSNELDPASRDYILGMRSRAMGFADRPMSALDPAFLQALSGMQGYANAGQMGVNAMTDPAAAAKFMNPYFASMLPQFDQMRMASLNNLNKTATAAGAFGARRGLAQGNALRDVNNAQSQFAYTGFNDAMARAMQLAGFGMGANQWLGTAGQYMTDRQRNYDIGSLGLIQGGYGSPLYTSTTTPNDKGNPFQAALGGFATGMSFAKPGTAAPMVAPSYMPAGSGSENDPWFGMYPGAGR